MIKLLELFPKHLNLNGDAGNLLVLEKRIAWGGLSVSRNSLLPGHIPSERPDVLLIGHGSAAAWKQIYPELARLAPTIQEWLSAGTQVLAISSGFAALHGLINGLPSSIDRMPRVSKFLVEEYGDETVIGYINTDLRLPALLISENLIGSMLHGPLLAKNSWLADKIIEKAQGSAKRSAIDVSRLDEVELLEQAARSLAAEQAND
ncbi:MAG: hypothetical protein ACKOWR_02005 [Micrococcales bacterium]